TGSAPPRGSWRQRANPAPSRSRRPWPLEDSAENRNRVSGTTMTHAEIIAGELGVDAGKVERTLKLLGEGATIPFISRYRKEVTGGLEEVQIGTIDERPIYLGELDARKQTVRGEIASQGKLTDELKRKIEATLEKPELEDLYLPYKPKRRTRATIARER